MQNPCGQIPVGPGAAGRARNRPRRLAGLHAHMLDAGDGQHRATMAAAAVCGGS